MSKIVTFLRRIMHALTDALERNAQQRTREYLLSLSDRHLQDMGFSRELIKQGPNAWPWRIPEEPVGTLSAAMREHKTERKEQPADADRGQRGFEQAAGFNPPSTGDKLAA